MAEVAAERGISNVTRTYLAMVIVVAGLSMLPSVAFADPVAECQVITTNQVETGQCLTDTLVTADAVMATALENTQAAADELDHVTGRVVARPALDRAQTAWAAFRALNCEVPAAMAGGASGSGHFTLGCQIEMARARTHELQGLR
jgi:uncharacterized protein YecT (DUF1311 family)